MQISQAFDVVTIKKIQHSAWLSIAGFAVSALPMLLPGVLEMAKDYPVIVALVSAGVPWCVNLIKEWMKGE